jgi:hypothetical protein
MIKVVKAMLYAGLGGFVWNTVRRHILLFRKE